MDIQYGETDGQALKKGANYSDIRMIKQLAREGHSAEAISDALRIELACVESFAADPDGRVKGVGISQKTPDMPPIVAKAPEPEPEPEPESKPKTKAKSKKKG